MRMLPPLAFVAAVLAAPAAAQPPATQASGTANGTLVTQTPCAFPGYDETSAFTRRYYTRAEYAATSTNPAVDCLRMQYLSDGLKVVGFIVKPHTGVAAGHPVI